MGPRDGAGLALVEGCGVVGVGRGAHGEHEEADEVVAEDDGGEYDEHYEDGVEGFAVDGVGDGEGEVWVGCQL